MNADVAPIDAPGHRAQLLWWWILLCAFAECAGVALAALWYGAVAVGFGEPDDIVARIGVWLLLTAAAVPEGLVLGGLQATGLRWFLPELSLRRFVGATIAVGLIGWGIGSFIPLFVFHEPAGADAIEPSLMAVAGFAAVFGSAIGSVFGAFQAWALPVGAASRLRWVAANAVGWALALPLIYMAAQWAADSTGVAPKVLLWAAGGGAAGLTIGTATAVVIPALRRGENGGLSGITS